MSEELEKHQATVTNVAKSETSLSETPSSTQQDIKEVDEKYADATLRFYLENAKNYGPLTPEKEKKLKRKLYGFILFFATFTALTLYEDKASLSYASILGIFEDCHINKTQYNNLNTVFSCGYLAALYPGHYLMQRLPLGKFSAVVIFLWSVILFLHCVARNYSDLIALRFFLGFVEAVIIPGLQMTLSSFFTREENARLQPIFWISCQAQNLPGGFIAYGSLFATAVAPWKVFMIILGGVTFVLAVYSWFFYPDSPASARFLTIEERVHTIYRVQQSTGSSLQQRIYKKEQAWEAVKDPLSWLFGLQGFTLMFGNNLSYQQNLIIKSVGLNNLNSTLVSAAGGGFSVVICIFALFHIKWLKDQIAYAACFYFVPAIAGGIAMITIPWSRYISLLAALQFAIHFYGIAYILGLHWTISSCSGYTKKMTRMVIYMVCYAIASIVNPQIWVAKYYPRYKPTWIAIICVSWIGTPSILLLIRYILAKRNKERLQWIAEHEGAKEGIVREFDDSGNIEARAKVDRAMLDLTDLENKAFIYPL